MNVRKRITIDAELVCEAEQYLKDDHRSFSELICTALSQHMARYPKKQKNGLKTWQKTIDGRLCALEQRVQPGYMQVPCRAKEKIVTDRE